jgi:hypothetical protein
VGRELHATPVIKAFDGAYEPDRSFLHEIREWDAVSTIGPCHREHQPQIALDHQLPGGRVATLDSLSESDLLRRGQQRPYSRATNEHFDVVLPAARM